jgi:hypothetical protein
MTRRLRELAEERREEIQGLPAEMGEVPTDANQIYWRMLGELRSFGWDRLNNGSPELRTMHDLGCRSPGRAPHTGPRLTGQAGVARFVMARFTVHRELLAALPTTRLGQERKGKVP